MTIFLFYSILAVLCFSDLTGAKREVCQNPACISLASDIQNSMDGNIQPCEDFFKRSCGNWGKSHELGRGKPRVRNYLQIIQQRVYVRLQDILKTAKPKKDSSLMKAKKFYEACIGPHREEKDILGIIKNYIKKAGGWPITMRINEWKKNKLTWQGVHSKFSSVIGASLIFTLNVVNDPSTSGSKVPSVASSTIGFEVPVPISKDPKVFITEDAVLKYLGVIKDIAEKVKKGDSKLNKDQLETDAKGIFMFENKLRNSKSGSSVAPNIRTIEYLQTLSNHVTTMQPQEKIDWLTFIREIFIQPKSSLITINKSNTIQLMDESYFKSLPSTLADTPERDIINTIHWWFIKYTRSWNTNSQINEIIKKYIESSGVMKNQSPQRERWFNCITDNPLQGAMGAAYVEQYFPTNARTKVRRILKDVKSAMEHQIDQSEWIPDENSKRAAGEKLTAMIELVGGPDWYTDSAKADAYYQRLSISTSHFGNMLLGIKFIRQKELESLNEPANRNLWRVDPFVLRGAYSLKANHLVLTVAILQPPLFHVDYPDAVNYAGIGVIMGHEMSHAFDRKGSQYDKNGKKGSSWSPIALPKYETRSKCFETQFNAYRKDLGTRTLIENIADTTGVKLAFIAFKAHMTTPEYKDEGLPGFKELSPEELFFLSYANSWCENTDSSYRETYFESSKHAPHDLRINGSLSNSNDFAKTFSCREGIDPMHPVEKCNIW